MNTRPLLATLLVTTVCGGLSSALDRKITNGGRSGRLLRRHKRQSENTEEKRQAEENRITEEAANANELVYDARQLQTFESDSLPCISIVAVDAFRLLSSNVSANSNNTNGNDIIPYEASSRVVTDESFLCELSIGAFIAIQGTDEQYTEMRQMLNDGTLISAVSNIEVEMEAPIVTAEGIPTSSSVDDIVVTLPSGGIKLVDNVGDVTSRRRLDKFEGDKLVLLVRVTDVDGRSVPEDAYTISDKFFGTYGDTVTVKSVFEGCSFGKMQITSDYGTEKYDSKLSAPGVLDVTIDISLMSSTQTAIVNAAANAAMTKMGMSLPGSFAHVIFVLEGCYGSDQECNFAAYGYINHWALVTLGDNWQYPAVIVHELGHNLNLGHSGGMDGGTYTDHTCLMGNPLFDDNVGKMCFNPVKNFQIAKTSGWYTADTDIAYYNSGIMGGTSWRGRLIGVADYDNNPSNYPIILKVETGSGSDYFVSFNRATGINSEVQEAGDMVAIYRVDGGDGLVYSQSMLKATLSDGRSTTIENWRKSGLDLTINVIEINTWSSPAYADVEVLFGTQGMAYMQTSAATMTSTSSTVTFDSGTTDSKTWTGYIATMDSGETSFPTRVNLYTGSATSVYLEYRDGEVFIMKDSSGNESEIGKIWEWSTEIVEDWRYTGYDLSIEVKEANAEYASVELVFRP
ncbi:hypothetical protein ACHAW5_008827 [Stephanodiscus triporus]|uniref:Peptidase M11 gametolysin domain-containing protein n=1 Tax=Stephanodiscus triporus TaxID=2934178 RepID=A0ABD3MYW3_9STRA